MHIYKLSQTKAIASLGNEYNFPFYGSTYNRKPKKENIKKGVETTRQNIQSSKINSILCENKINQLGTQRQCTDIQQTEISNRCQLPPTISRNKTKTLSNRSKDKIRNKIEALYNATSGTKFTFCTLSFINKVDDKTAQKCLNKFLTVIRKRKKNFMYLWVAERQENNNIHFHLITNKFLEIEYYNNLWVLNQYNSGITHNSLSISQIHKYIANTTLKNYLNPFDIKRIDSVDALSLYLTAYVTKNNATFNCATWHCCRKISKLFTTTLVTENCFNEAKQTELNFNVNYTTGEVYETKTIVTDYAIIQTIQNKKYFNDNYQRELNFINSLIIKGHHFETIPQIHYTDYYNQYILDGKTIINNPMFDQLKHIKTKQKNDAKMAYIKRLQAIWFNNAN